MYINALVFAPRGLAAWSQLRHPSAKGLIVLSTRLLNCSVLSYSCTSGRGGVFQILYFFLCHVDWLKKIACKEANEGRRGTKKSDQGEKSLQLRAV